MAFCFSKEEIILPPFNCFQPVYMFHPAPTILMAAFFTILAASNTMLNAV